MGKRKIDKSKKIENRNQRNVAFCKRKRGLLKKAIEISRLCDQQIFFFMYDNEKKKAVVYCSDMDFQLKQAYETIKQLKQVDREKYKQYQDKIQQSQHRHSQRYASEKSEKDGPNVGGVGVSGFQPSLEYYRNEDYKKFELVDFRRVRYLKELPSDYDLSESDLEIEVEDHNIFETENKLLDEKSKAAENPRSKK